MDELRHYNVTRMNDIDNQILDVYDKFGITTELSEKEYDDIIKQLEINYKMEPLEQISEFNLQEKLSNNALEMLKYQEFLNKEKNTLDILERIKEIISGKMFDYYKFNYDKALKTTEIEKYYLPKDKRIIEIDNLIQKQGWRVSHLKARIIIEKEHWHLSHYSNNLKVGY